MFVNGLNKLTLLEQSLCLLKGVSHEAEIRLRRNGVISCRQLSENADTYFSASHANRIRESFTEWLLASSCGLVDWEINHLPPGHRVRALFDHWGDALFYDIETDGTNTASCITCISTILNGVCRSFWRGHNLTDFLCEWAKAKILVSFNGKRFDTPIVCKAFGLTSVPAQVDLMDEAAHYGYRGGLKKIEKQIGFVRKIKDCENGDDAIRLWNDYQDHLSEDSLKTLLAYNQEDVQSLIALSNVILKQSLANTLIIDN